MFKRVLSCLLLAVLLLSAAHADTSLITGEVVEVSTPGDIRILLNESGFEATYNDQTFMGAVQQDGTLLVGTRNTAVRLGALPALTLKDSIMARLDNQPTYDNAMYSSLFTQAQQIELPADEVCGYARALLSLCPLLDPDGTLRQAVAGDYGQDAWATVTRYVADPNQYPDTWMVQINVFSPVLPAMFVEYRQDEYGSNFEVAVSNGYVIDWDETIDAIENDTSGASGRLIRGFTMVYDNMLETSFYMEAAIFGFEQLWRMAVDMYIDDADRRLWEAVIVVNDDATDTPVAAAKLRSESTNQTPLAAFDGAVIVDGTDGLDAGERELLGLKF